MQILALAGKDWKTASGFIPSFAYAEDDPRRGCDTDDFGLAIDPISLLEIPSAKIISFYDMEKKWCFNIDILAEYVRRGKATNPMTRRPLPQAILNQLQEYEESNKTVHVEVHDGQRNTYSIKTFLGTPLVEVALDALRSCASCEGSILSKVLKYRFELSLPDWSFETELEGPLTIFIRRGVTITDLQELLASCRKRYSLQSIADVLEDELNVNIMFMSVIDVILYYSQLAGYPGIFYANVFLNDGTRDYSIYEFLSTPEDYHKKLGQVGKELDEVRVFYTLGYEDFVQHYRPLGKEMVFQQRFARLWESIQNTIDYYLHQVIAAPAIDDAQSKEKISIVKKLFNSPDYYRFQSDVSMPIVYAFSPEAVHEIMHKARMIPDLLHTPLEKIPRDFVSSGYYAQYTGFEGAEIQIMTDYFLQKTPLIDPNLQAKLIAYFDDVNLLQDYATTLNYEKLYAFIAESNADKVAHALAPSQQVELVLSQGYGMDVDVQLASVVFEEYIAQDKPLHSLGFNMVFLGLYAPPGTPLLLPVQKLYPLLLRLA